MNVPGMANKLNDAQVPEIGNSLAAIKENKSKEYGDSNAKDTIIKEQTEIEVRDMIPVFPQTPKNDLPSGFHQNLTREDQDRNQQIEIGLSRMAESPRGPPSSDYEIQDAVLKVGFKVSCWVTAISATGIISGLEEGHHKYTNLTLNHLFMAFMISLFGSFMSGACLFVLSIIRPNICGLIPTVKIITLISTGLMTIAVGLGTCIVLQTGNKN